MSARNLIAGLAFLCSLSFAGLAVAQEPKPEPRPGPGKEPTLLERRVAELEKQLQSLAREVQSLRKEVKPSIPRLAKDHTVKLFSLRKADAAEVAKTLQQLLDNDELQAIRIATHRSTNSIILRGDPERLDVLETIIARLEDETAQMKDVKGKRKR